MSERERRDEEGPPVWPAARDTDRVGVSRPNTARVYDYLLDGKDNFGPDRRAAEAVLAVAPWAREAAKANRAFLARAVTYLTRAGVSQFLDVGTGFPTLGNVHEIAERVDPQVRVAYVDNDPMVLSHARALLANDHTVTAADGDVRDPHTILANPQVGKLIDFTRPVAVLFAAILHFLNDEDDPAAVVAAFVQQLTPGSFLLITHACPTGDAAEQTDRVREAAEVYNSWCPTPTVLRDAEQIRALFAGTRLIAPGLVPLNDWRPDLRTPARHRPVPLLGGVGRVEPRADATTEVDCDRAVNTCDETGVA